MKNLTNRFYVDFSYLTKRLENGRTIPIQDLEFSIGLQTDVLACINAINKNKELKHSGLEDYINALVSAFHKMETLSHENRPELLEELVAINQKIKSYETDILSNL